MTELAGVRRGSHLAWLVVGGVVTAVALLLTSVGIWTWLARLATETETEQGSHLGPVSRVVVDTDRGDLVLVAGEAGRVTFERRLEWSGSRPTVEETWDGGTFHVTARCAGGPIRLGIDPVCSAGYTMAVPAEAAVEVRSGSGEIEVRGLAGEVRVSGSHDSVTIADLAGPVTLQTGSGDIVGSGLRSGRVEVRVGSGDVDLRFAAAPDLVTVAATSGNPTIEVPDGDRYRVSVDTSTGHQEIGVVADPDAAGSLDIRTTTGDVRVRYLP